MTRDDQKQFVEQLTATVLDTILDHIAKGRVPESWDGTELRQFLADKFDHAAYVKMPRKRAQEYRNTVLVKNL